MTPAARPALAAAAALAAGCALFRSEADGLRADVVDTALDQVGEDYRYGGAHPDDGFDCSGLVHYSFGAAGVRLPRSAAAQRRAGRPVRFGEARPADLLFYRFDDRKPGDLHVAIYVGDGEAVHAPVRGGEVEVVDVTSAHWRRRYVGATRVIRDD